ncbi:hypothetical protein [Streptomyces sp. SYSU K21746]
MTFAPSALAAVGHHQSGRSVAAVVAPHGDDGEYEREFALRGWQCVAVTLPSYTLPPAYAGMEPHSAYAQRVSHAGSLRRTVKKLRAMNVSAVVAGSALGVELTDRLAHAMSLPGNDPATSLLRRDRGVQAAALADAGVAAPRGLRTDRLADALAWTDRWPLTEYVIAPADSSVAASARRCRNRSEVCAAWREIRRVSHRHTSEAHLVIQEYVPGPQYLVNSVTSRALDGTVEHVITEIWSETRTDQQLHDRSDLLGRHTLMARALSLYTMRVLDVLGVESGPVRSRIVFVPGRGAVLLAARAYARPSPAHDVTYAAHGSGPFHHAVDAAVCDGVQRAARGGSRVHLARVSLIAPQDGALDARLLRMLTTLPTVAQVVGPLRPSEPVRRTVDRSTSPGELVLLAPTRRALEEDYRIIRAAEALGLYQGNAQGSASPGHSHSPASTR